MKQYGKCWSSGSGAIEAMLRLIETTVPIQRLWLDAVDPREVEVPVMDDNEAAVVEPILRLVFSQLIDGEGLSPEEAKRRLLRTEPFQKFPQLVQEICTTQPARAS
jgi:hypothetical protein